MGDWTRHGECSECGWCCEYLARVPYRADPGQDPELLTLRGFTKGADGTFRATIEAFLPCPMHQEGHCAIYERRPQGCRDYPTIPLEVIDTPCSYWFEREHDGALERAGGNGSPYPGLSHA